MPTFNDIPNEFNRRFPEWIEEFAEDFEIGSYIGFARLFEKAEPAISSENFPLVRKIFDFAEDVAVWDEASATLVHIEFGEPLISHPDYLNHAGPFVREAVRQINHWNHGHAN